MQVSRAFFFFGDTKSREMGVSICIESLRSTPGGVRNSGAYP